MWTIDRLLRNILTFTHSCSSSTSLPQLRTSASNSTLSSVKTILTVIPRTDFPPTRERKSYHRGDLQRALVKTALSLLTKTPRWDFSLREVARCAGVSHNAPYSHFADKRQLLAAVAAKGYEVLKARTLTAVRGKVW